MSVVKEMEIIHISMKARFSSCVKRIVNIWNENVMMFSFQLLILLRLLQERKSNYLHWSPIPAATQQTFTCQIGAGQLLWMLYHHLPLTAATPSSSHQQPRPCPDLQVREDRKLASHNEVKLLVGTDFSFFVNEALGRWSHQVTNIIKQIGKNQENA